MRRLLLVVAFVFVPIASWPQGNPIGPEFRVNTYTTVSQRAASVAADASGNFVVVWNGNDQDGSLRGVFGQRYDSSGAPLGGEFRVNTFTTGLQTYPSIAADASGNFVVAWRTFAAGGASYDISGQRFASTGAPLGAEFRVNTTTPNAQAAPSVATDNAGNFVVVWQSDNQDGSLSGIFGQRYTIAGVPLGPEFRVNTYTTNAQYLPSVVSDPAGNFVVAWTSYTQDGHGEGVFGQRYASSGAPVGAEFRVNTFTTQFQIRPSVAADASGNFVVIWDSTAQDGSIDGIFGQRYAASGDPLGSEFRVNTFTNSYQGDPSVAADPLGRFVVVWTSYLQDGGDLGVYGQRYEVIVPVELMRFRVE